MLGGSSQNICTIDEMISITRRIAMFLMTDLCMIQVEILYAVEW